MASNKFVRASLYRHVHGVPSKPENEFTHIKAQATGDGTFIAANEKLFAYAGALPGRVHIWPLDKPGRIGADAPYIHVHKAGVLDYEFNTLFHDELTGGGTASLLATGSDDCAVAVTAIPNTGLKSNITDATLSLQGHERRVNVVHWHPTASNLLATGSADQTIKVWDIGAQKEALSFDGFGDGVSAFDWHCHGAHLIATCKDTKVRVYDPRSTDSVQTFQGFNGAGISRMVWKGDSTQVIGVGNIKGGSRQMGIWDTKNPSKPIMVQDLDNAGGSLFPYYDPDNTILYISGKGDGQIRYWEVTEDEPYVHFISAFTDTKSHAGVAFLPKKACDYAECEIAIALRMMGDKVTKVSFRVPRKQTGPTVFHKDLYPETSSGLKPASLSADEWLAGENRPIVKMPMNIASGAREMSSALATPTSRAASASVSGTVSPRGVSTSLSAPASTSGRSIPELERMLAQAKLKIMDLQAEVFELEQKAAKKTLDKDSAATVKAASTATASSTSAAASASASAAATATSPTASNTTSPVSSPRDSSASITTRDAAASISISTEALPGESEAQTAARIKKAKAKAAADARDYAAREKEAAKAAEKNTSAELDKAKKEAEEKIRREQQAAQAERDAEKKAKEEKEKADKKLKEEQHAAEKKVKEEKEKAEKKAKEEKEKAEKKAKEDKEAAEKKIKEEKEAAEKKSKAEKEKAEKEAATLKAEKEADLRKASAASADSDASHHMRFHGDDDDEDDDDAEAERLRAETVAKAEAIERAEAVAKKQKEIEAKAKATMEDKKKKAKDDASDMKTSASAAVSAATSAAASPTNSAPSSEPSSPTGSKKGKKGKKDKKDKKKGDCIIC